MNVTLDIHRLVLDGLTVTAPEADRIRLAAEQELTRLLAAPSRPRQWPGGAMPTVAAPPIRVAPGASPETIGTQIARSVHAGLDPSSLRMGD